MALPKARRFTGRREVTQVLHYGRRIQTPLGLARFAPSPRGRGRVLFVISSRIMKKSSARNLLRRRLSEWWRRQEPSALDRADLTITISPAAAQPSVKDLRARAEETFLQLTRLLANQ